MISGAPSKWLVVAATAAAIAAVGAEVISSSAMATSDRSRGKPHLADRRRGQSATEASCAGLTRAEQRAAAKVIVIGWMLPGPSTQVQTRQVLLSPARLQVSRYLKGSGPRTVAVQTGVRLSNGQVQMEEDGILPSAGQRWELLSSSRQMPLQSSTCLGSRRSTGSPSPHESTIDPAVAVQLSVFRRVRTSADALPAAFRAELQDGHASARPDFAESRRVKASDGQAAYLVPANGGACVINTNEAFCSQAASLPGAEALDLCSPALPQGQLEMEWLLPDGATNVAVDMTDGTARSFAPGFNVYIARFPISGLLPKAIEWHAGGQHHSVSAGVPSDAQREKCAHPTDLPTAPKPSSKPTATVKTISLSPPGRILHPSAANATLRKAATSFRNHVRDERHSS